MRWILLAACATLVGALVFGPWDTGTPTGAGVGCGASASGGASASVSNTAGTIGGPSAGIVPGCSVTITT